MRIRRFGLLETLYLVFGLISVALIILYFVPCIEANAKNVCLSIGSSIFGAVILGIFIDLINYHIKIKTKKSILSDLVLASRKTLKELDIVFDEFKNDDIISRIFKNEEDFIKNSVNYYLSLTNKRTKNDDYLAEQFQNAIIDNIINKSFIIDCCKETIVTLQIILNSQNSLIINGYLTKEDIKILRSAKYKMSRLISESESPRFCILLSNALDFKDELLTITKINI